jgi:hypothetical protein
VALASEQFLCQGNVRVASVDDCVESRTAWELCGSRTL